MRLTKVAPFVLLLTTAATCFPAQAQAPYPYGARSLAECYRLAPTTAYFNGLNRGICDLIDAANELEQTRSRNNSAPRNNYRDGIDYIELGRNIRISYESPTEVWADGARGFVSQEGDVYRITKQIADDGNVVYYLRVNSQPRIYRYNATQDSAGYTDVWSYSIGSGYLKCRVTMVSANGRYLPNPQITQVETNDMYPAISTLLAFE